SSPKCWTRRPPRRRSSGCARRCWSCADAFRCTDSSDRDGTRRMHCPFCGHVETKVTDSRLAGEGRQIRRRRECLKCGERFTTFEAAELLMPMVIKGDRGREAFDEGKLRTGMEKALQKRPVTLAKIDDAIRRVVQKVRSLIVGA